MLAVYSFEPGPGYTLQVTSDPLSRYEAEHGDRLAMRLKPHASSELVDTALRIYQRQGIRFLRLTALPAVFCLAATAFVFSYVLPAFTTTKNANSVGVQAGEVVFTVLLALVVAGPLFLGGLTYASAIIVKLTSDELEGRVTSDDDAQLVARRMLPRLFWLNLRELLLSSSGILVAIAVMLLGSLLTSLTPSDSPVAGLVAAVGLIGVFGGGFICLVIISLDALALPIAVNEGLDGKFASRRSRKLLSSQKHRNFTQAPVSSAYGPIWNIYASAAITLVGTFATIKMVMAVANLEERLVALFAGTILKSVVSLALDLLPLYFAIWISIPIWAAAITVIYYERRVRLEGYDIFTLSKLIKEDRASRFSV